MKHRSLIFPVLCLTLCLSACGPAAGDVSSAPVSSPSAAQPSRLPESPSAAPDSDGGSLPVGEPLLAVLRNQQGLTVEAEGEFSDLDAYLASLPASYEFDRFAVCDLDHDGAPEVILNITTGGDLDVCRLILHEQDGAVFGYALPYRGFYDLKTDGTFSASAGAADHGVQSIAFDGKTYTCNDITYCRSVGEPAVQYFVDHEEATAVEFDAALARQGEKANVEWRDFTDTNINELPH